jgi:nucleoside 2-deoxyribosyltransferase
MKCPHCGRLMRPFTLSLVQCPDDNSVADMKKLIYLASPYSSTDPQVVLDRVDATAQALARLIESGELVFSPIIHSHPIAHLVSFSALNHTEGELSGWMKFDFDFISKCDEVWVLQLDGWEQSRGIAAEIEYAESQQKPVRYIQA